MFKNDKDQDMNSPFSGKDQDMKSPFSGKEQDIKSPMYDLMSSARDKEIKSPMYGYTRAGNGQIQGPHFEIPPKNIEQFFRDSTYNSVIASCALNQQKKAMQELYNEFKDWPGLNLDSAIRKGFEQAYRDITELQNRNICCIPFDEEDKK